MRISLYAAIGEGKRLIRERRDGPLMQSRRLSRAQLDMASASIYAYTLGWDYRLAYLNNALPDTSAKFIIWVANSFERNRQIEPEKLARVLAALEVLWEAIDKQEPP